MVTTTPANQWEASRVETGREPLVIDGGPQACPPPWPSSYTGGLHIGEEERREVNEVLDRKSLYRFYGPETPDKVATLEREFASRIGTQWALGVTSGTAALKVGLAGLGVGPGDEVIVPAVTFIASAGAVLSHHAYCVFAEIDESFGLDPEDVARKITSRTKVIMPVHLGGVACRMDALAAVATAHDVPILEDCAQSAGTTYKGRQIGSFGAVGAFSFQMQKILTAGEGGLLTTSDPEVYERAFRYHDHGGYRFGRQGVRVSGSSDAAGTDDLLPPAAQLEAIVGEVYRMNELTGAVALAQLRKLESIVAIGRANKRFLTEALSGLKGFRLRDVPDPEGDVGSRLGLILDDPTRTEPFCKAMRAEGVPIAPLYGGEPVYAAPQILHRRPHWARDNADALRRPLVPVGEPYGPPVHYEMGMCPRTEALLKRIVSLDISGRLSQEQLEGAARAFHKLCGVVL